MLPPTLLRSPPTPTTMEWLTSTLALPSASPRATMAPVLLRDPTLSTFLTAVSRLSTTMPTTSMVTSLRSPTLALLPTLRLSLLLTTLLPTLLLITLWPIPLLLPMLLLWSTLDTVLLDMVLQDTVLLDMVWLDTVLLDMVWLDTVLLGTVLLDMVLQDMALSDTAVLPTSVKIKSYSNQSSTNSNSKYHIYDLSYELRYINIPMQIT